MAKAATIVLLIPKSEACELCVDPCCGSKGAIWRYPKSSQPRYLIGNRAVFGRGGRI